MEDLDEELIRNVWLVTGKSFNCNEDGWGGNDKDIESVDVGCWEEMKPDGL